MEISQLDALPDKRISPFFKMSYFEILIRLIAFIAIIYINEKEWLNPHNPHEFIFKDYKIPKIHYIPYLSEKIAEEKEMKSKI